MCGFEIEAASGFCPLVSAEFPCLPVFVCRFCFYDAPDCCHFLFGRDEIAYVVWVGAIEVFKADCSQGCGADTCRQYCEIKVFLWDEPLGYDKCEGCEYQ